MDSRARETQLSMISLLHPTSLYWRSFGKNKNGCNIFGKRMVAQRQEQWLCLGSSPKFAQGLRGMKNAQHCQYGRNTPVLASGKAAPVCGSDLYQQSMEANMHPDKNPIMKHFNYGHLPPHLQKVSAPICDLARQMDEALPNGPEKSAGLRKLLEAKDCFVRASLD